MSEKILDGKTYILVHTKGNSCKGCVIETEFDAVLCSSCTKETVWKRKENTEIQEELKAIETEAYTQAIHDKYKEEPKGKQKYHHYIKDVSHLECLDIYRVCDLWGVIDPCIQHSVKKLLAAGNRGYKDIAKDIQEAIDSLERWKEMQVENKRATNSQEEGNL